MVSFRSSEEVSAASFFFWSSFCFLPFALTFVSFLYVCFGLLTRGFVRHLEVLGCQLRPAGAALDSLVGAATQGGCWTPGLCAAVSTGWEVHTSVPGGEDALSRTAMGPHSPTPEPHVLGKLLHVS